MNIFARVDTLATCNESSYFPALRPTLKTGNEIFYLLLSIFEYYISFTFENDQPSLQFGLS